MADSTAVQYIMPSKTEYNQSVDHLFADNKAMDIRLVHGLLHEGFYEVAEKYAKDIGLNTPPEQRPLYGFSLADEQRAFLEETLASHMPTASGLPDHEL